MQEASTNYQPSVWIVSSWSKCTRTNQHPFRRKMRELQLCWKQYCMLYCRNLSWKLAFCCGNVPLSKARLEPCDFWTGSLTIYPLLCPPGSNQTLMCFSQSSLCRCQRRWSGCSQRAVAHSSGKGLLLNQTLPLSSEKGQLKNLTYTVVILV